MLVSYNVMVGGNRTSVRLELEMGDGLQEINYQEGAYLYQICTSIDIQKCKNASLAAAIRVFIMCCFCPATTEESYNKI